MEIVKIWESNNVMMVILKTEMVAAQHVLSKQDLLVVEVLRLKKTLDLKYEVMVKIWVSMNETTEILIAEMDVVQLVNLNHVTNVLVVRQFQLMYDLCSILYQI